MRPMLASAGDHVPTGDGWSHEVKWDGMRILAEVTGAGVRLFSRNGNDVTPAWPDLTGPATSLCGTAAAAGGKPNIAPITCDSRPVPRVTCASPDQWRRSIS